MIKAQKEDLSVALQRQLGLPRLILYGTGMTIGAGIYVLIGAIAGHSGVHASWSLLVAAVVMVLTVASYTEFSALFPVSAEARFLLCYQCRAVSFYCHRPPRRGWHASFRPHGAPRAPAFLSSVGLARDVPNAPSPLFRQPACGF